MTEKQIIYKINQYISYMRSMGKSPGAIYLNRAQINKLRDCGRDHTQYNGIPIKQS